MNMTANIIILLSVVCTQLTTTAAHGMEMEHGAKYEKDGVEIESVNEFHGIKLQFRDKHGIKGRILVGNKSAWIANAVESTKTPRLTARTMKVVLSLSQIDSILIEQVYLEENALDGLVGHAGLAEVTIDRTNLSDHHIARIAQTTALRNLCIRDSMMTDEGVVVISGISTLRYISLDNNKFIPVVFARKKLRSELPAAYLHIGRYEFVPEWMKKTDVAERGQSE